MKATLLSLLFTTFAALSYAGPLSLASSDGSCRSDLDCVTYCVLNEYTIGQCEKNKCTCVVPLLRKNTNKPIVVDVPAKEDGDDKNGPKEPAPEEDNKGQESQEPPKNPGPAKGDDEFAAEHGDNDST